MQESDLEKSIAVFEKYLAGDFAVSNSSYNYGDVWLISDIELPELQLMSFTIPKFKHTSIEFRRHSDPHPFAPEPPPPTTYSARAYISKINFPKDFPNQFKENIGSVAAILITLASGALVESYWDFRNHYDRTKDGADAVIINPSLNPRRPGHAEIIALDTHQTERNSRLITQILKSPKEDDIKQFLSYSRLFWLARKSTMFDQSLSFSLTIAAIESVAQYAIPDREIRNLFEWEEEWRVIDAALSENAVNEKTKETIKKALVYKNVTKRFTEFVKKNTSLANIDLKSKYEHHFPDDPSAVKSFEKNEEMLDRWNKIIHENKNIFDWDLEAGDYLTDILEKTYSYRSSFIHAGRGHHQLSTEEYGRYLCNTSGTIKDPTTNQSDFEELGKHKEKIFNLLKAKNCIIKNNDPSDSKKWRIRTRQMDAGSAYNEIEKKFGRDARNKTWEIIYGLHRPMNFSLAMMMSIAQQSGLNYFKKTTNIE